VDFVHQFCHQSVPKEDKRRFERHLSDGRLGAMVPTSPFGDGVFTEKCSGFDSPCLCCARIQKAAVSVASGKFMQSFSAFFALLVLGIGCT
jgi:hypothetical protein